MADQPDLFDFAAAEKAKQLGMDLAATSKRELLEFARRLAIEIALSRPSREVNADDVQKELHSRGVGIFTLGNAAGSLFRGAHWLWTGKWVKSERIHSHSNQLRVWRYVGDQTKE